MHRLNVIIPTNSYAMLSEARKCPLKYRLTYIEKIDEKAAKLLFIRSKNTLWLSVIAQANAFFFLVVHQLTAELYGKLLV